MAEISCVSTQKGMSNTETCYSERTAACFPHSLAWLIRYMHACVLT